MNTANIADAFLGGYQNALALKSGGQQAGLAANEATQRQVMQQLYQQHGPGIAAGNPQSLNALAQHDPLTTLDAQSKLLSNQGTGLDNKKKLAQLRILDVEAAIKVQEQAANMDDRQRQEAAREINDAIGKAATLYQTGDLQGLNMMLVGAGEQPLQSLDDFPAVAMRYEDVRDMLDWHGEFTAPPAPVSQPGKVSHDIRTGWLPEGTPLRAEPASTQVNVNNGGLDETAFQKETAKLLAAEASDVYNQGLAAQRNLRTIEELDRAMAASPSGLGATLTQFAASKGLKLEGASEVERATALINQLVPQQRTPGSGQMSDRDVQLFIDSLPQLMNTREGNQKIISAMRAMAEYDVSRGNIARQMQLGQLTPAQATEAYNDLGNPLSGFGGAPEPQAAKPQGANLTAGDMDFGAMSVEELQKFIAENGG